MLILSRIGGKQIAILFEKPTISQAIANVSHVPIGHQFQAPPLENAVWNNAQDDILTKARQSVEQEKNRQQSVNDIANMKLDPNKLDKGNTLGFREKIKAILEQGNANIQRAMGGEPIKASELVAKNQAALDPSMTWAHQNPLADGMGYQWNDTKMKEAGLTDEDIADYKSITDMHPQMIEDLRNRGYLISPYRLPEVAQQPGVSRPDNRSYDLSSSYTGLSTPTVANPYVIRPKREMNHLNNLTETPFVIRPNL